MPLGPCPFRGKPRQGGRPPAIGIAPRGLPERRKDQPSASGPASASAGRPPARQTAPPQGAGGPAPARPGTSTPPGRFRYGGRPADIVAAGGAVGCLGHRLGRGQDGADPLGRMGGGRRPGLAKRAVALAKVVEDGRQIARNGRCDIRRPGQRRDAFRRSSPRSGPRRRRRPSPSRGPGWPAGARSAAVSSSSASAWLRSNSSPCCRTALTLA
jgi:hypothetical protein